MRTRTRTTPEKTGRARFQVGSSGFDMYASLGWIQDRVIDWGPGTYVDKPFESFKGHQRGGLINGKQGLYEHWNYPIQAYQQPTSVFVNFPDVNVDMLAANVLARSNPSKPSLDIVAFIAQWPQTIELLELRGRTLLKKFFGSYVKYQFEIATLIDDLLHLALFVQEVNRRMKRLNDAYKYGNSIKKVRLGTLKYKESSVSYINSITNLIQAELTFHHESNLSGYCRWYPQFPHRPHPADELKVAAIRATLGIDFSLRTAWELVPWSWLIDWFTNFGDLLDSYRNVVNMVPGEPCVMQHAYYRITDKILSSHPTLHIKPYFAEYERKTRWPKTPSLSATIPLLEDSQLAILASIKASR